MSDWSQAAPQGWPQPTDPAERVVTRTDNGPPEALPTEGVVQPAPQLTEADKTKRVNLWLSHKATLATAKTAEEESRALVSDALFPNPVKGTQRYTDPVSGAAIKLVHGWNYTLGDKDKIDPSSGLKLPIATQVERVLDAIAELGERGEAIADRIVKWKPELAVTEYEALALSEVEVDIKAKTLIDEILTVKPAAPQLTFEPPKAKKGA